MVALTVETTQRFKDRPSIFLMKYDKTYRDHKDVNMRLSVFIILPPFLLLIKSEIEHGCSL